MSNQQSKQKSGSSSSNDDLENRRARTNAVYDQLLNADNNQRRARNDMRLAPVYDGFQHLRNYNRDLVMERELERATAQATARRVEEEERRSNNVNWCGRSNSNAFSKGNNKKK